MVFFPPEKKTWSSSKTITAIFSGVPTLRIFMVKCLTHIHMASFLCDIGKQYRPCSDANQACHSFPTRISIQNEIGMEKNMWHS